MMNAQGYLFFQRILHISFIFIAIFLVTSLNTIATEFDATPWQGEQEPLQIRLLLPESPLHQDTIYTLGIQIQPQPHWYHVWRTPKIKIQDNKYPVTSLQVTVSGLSDLYLDDIQWPIPEQLTFGDLYHNQEYRYGYTDLHTLFVDFSIPTQDQSLPHLELTVDVSWTACSIMTHDCQQGETSQDIVFELITPEQPQLFHQTPPTWLTQVLQQQSEPAAWSSHYEVLDQYIHIQIKDAELSNTLQKLPVIQQNKVQAFVDFPADWAVLASGQQEIRFLEQSLVLSFPIQPASYEASTQKIELAPLWVQLTTPQGNYEFYTKPVQPPAFGDLESTAPALLMIFIFAFLGGLILNLMPCVFPILSLKALSLSQQKHKEGLWYTLGVLLSFLIIAALLLILRQAGFALGWGYQLQSPWFILVLCFLFLAIALNLHDVFQLGSRLVTVAGKLQETSSQGSAHSSFLTGILAVMVASPCTAPFMGVALGYAITQPPFIALSIFAILGIGFASPFLLLSLFPQLRRFLPRPGAWMLTFKQWMALPMYLTVVWLIWVFGRQTGINSLSIALVALVFFAMGLWYFGSQQKQTHQARTWVYSILLIIASVLSITAINQASSPTLSRESTNVWSEQRLLDLQHEQRIVFVNMTADWCITCLANEALVLHTQEIQDFFNEHQVVSLTGDWTRQDPAITQFLATFGRNGVPLYLLYVPGKEPIVLPQILTIPVLKNFILETL